MKTLFDNKSLSGNGDYYEKDVKKFIRELKEIDKLAGEKLTK